MKNYDVIIVGGGPAGAALAIELGMNQINTLLIEKHNEPLLSPRAQGLNARSMEFFRRWNLAEEIKQKKLLPADLAMQGIWCSGLNGQLYASSNLNEQLNDSISPEQWARIPLWLTEEILRNKLKELSSVTFLKQHTACDIQLNEDSVVINAKTDTNDSKKFQAKYLVACDGANSLIRNKVGIEFEALSPPKRFINIMLESSELEQLITVDKGILYFLLANENPAAIGPVDLHKGLWYAQIQDNSDAKSINELDITTLLDKITGISFAKKIIQAHFWHMHIQLAKNFAKDNRVFLVGDSAHSFAPSGGFGLNTGLGDVVNLGWKLAAVIKQQASPALLETYEPERRIIALNNLKTAQRNATDMMETRIQHNPQEDPEAFAKANAIVAKRHTQSLGATMGYAYFNSALTSLLEGQSTQTMDQFHYQPTIAPGYFLPHQWVDKNTSIYDLLAPDSWTLITTNQVEDPTEKNWLKKFNFLNLKFAIVRLENFKSRYKYVLIRPDWHIAFVGNELTDDYFVGYLNNFYSHRT